MQNKIVQALQATIAEGANSIEVYKLIWHYITEIAPEPTNFKEFRALYAFMPVAFYQNHIGSCETEAAFVIVYRAGFIEYHPKRKEFFMIIDRSDYASENIATMEQRLWDDFSKIELPGMTEELIEADLHQRAKFLLDLLGEDCSLDEVKLTDHPKFMPQIEYLLRQFNNG